MALEQPDTEQLIQRVGDGDASAVQRLLVRHRDRLRQTVAVRMDARLAARVDASDVVQETFVEASGKLPRYVLERPLPFHLWLRRLACDRLSDLYDRHLRAQKRSVGREVSQRMQLSDQSQAVLVDRLVAGGSSPSESIMRKEMRQRVRTALEQLPDHDREILIMRHLEGLSIREIAVVLGITQSAAKMRCLRATKRLLDLSRDDLKEIQP